MAMDKKPSAIYEPGELNRIRKKLGDMDIFEARRMAQILGGEVGVEKNAHWQPPKKNVKHDTVELMVPGRSDKRPRRTVEVAGDDDYMGSDDKSFPLKLLNSDPADDPSIMLKTTYKERVKMDRFAAQLQFDIKSPLQVFVSMLSFFHEPVDYVSSRFVNRRMNIYYDKIGQLVTATRALLPRHNTRRSERLKKASPYVHSILETIRYWNTERIGEDLAKIQAHPRSARVSEFGDILRSIYRPLFILERLDIDTHIKGAYKLLYKLLYIENPTEPLEKNQSFIRVALAALADIRREVHFGLYPLLMKCISDRWLPYEQLFTERSRRFMAFIGVTEDDQIKPVHLSPEQAESGNLEAIQEEIKAENAAQDAQTVKDTESSSDLETVARKAHLTAAEAEQKVLDHSLKVMETLFPKAGWERLPQYPDMYPYFSGIYDLRRGYELISPTDPLQQIAILMHILDDVCAGLRYISFGLLAGPDGIPSPVDDAIGPIIAGWRRYIEDSFSKEYLPRLADYCRMIEHSPDAKNSMYVKRNMNELRWSKRLYFLPYYKFDSLGPPPFQKQDTIAVYSQVKTLRKYLTQVAAGIEQGNRAGGAAAKAPCNGIDNPWSQYHFEVPNPVSKRLNALLGPGKQNNAALVFFALSIVTVLDNLVNGENSWAYGDTFGVVFRSVNGAGIVPVFGVDDKIDADQIFKDTLRRKKEKRAKS